MRRELRRLGTVPAPLRRAARAGGGLSPADPRPRLGGRARRPSRRGRAGARPAAARRSSAARPSPSAPTRIAEQDADRASASNRMWKILGCGGFYLGPLRAGHRGVRGGRAPLRLVPLADEAAARAGTTWRARRSAGRIAEAGRDPRAHASTYARRLELLLSGRSYELGHAPSDERVVAELEDPNRRSAARSPLTRNSGGSASGTARGAMTRSGSRRRARSRRGRPRDALPVNRRMPGTQSSSGLALVGVAPWVHRLAQLALLAQRLRRAGPAVVEHLGRRESRADLPVLRAHPKSLRALVRAGCRAPDPAAPPAPPAGTSAGASRSCRSPRRNGGSAPAAPRPADRRRAAGWRRRAPRRRARAAPRRPGCRSPRDGGTRASPGASRGRGRVFAPAHVPLGLDDADLRDRAMERTSVERLVLGAPHVDHHLVADRQDASGCWLPPGSPA